MSKVCIHCDEEYFGSYQNHDCKHPPKVVHIEWADKVNVEDDQTEELLKRGRAMNIDEMPAGREMDELVFVKVMDRDPREVNNGIMPRYSTSIEAAWEVVEILRNGFDICLIPDSGWSAQFYPGGIPKGANAQTAPLAICRAALKAVL